MYSSNIISILALAVSFVAVCISFFSLRIKIKQLEISQDSNVVQRRMIAADQHEKYSNELKEVINLHKADFGQLNAQAGDQ